MNGKPLWDDLRVFLAISRAGTLSGAARDLGLGLATVSRRIERLEAALGQPLFLRTQSGYRLTEDGAAMVERTEEMEAAARALTTGMAHSPGVSGRVRLATAENLATALILPALPALQARHPALANDLVTDIATVNLHRRDADLALRMVKPERGHVTLQRVGTLGYGLYAAQPYLDRRPAQDQAITWAEAQAHLPAAQWIRRHVQGRAPVLTTTTLATQLAACAAGMGVAILPHLLARPRGLVCLADEPRLDQAIWLAVQSDLTRARRVQAVAEFCREVVGRNRQALAGR